MSDFVRKLQEMAPATELKWSTAQTTWRLREFHTRLHRRRKQKWVALAALTSVLLVTAMVAAVHWRLADKVSYLSNPPQSGSGLQVSVKISPFKGAKRISSSIADSPAFSPAISTNVLGRNITDSGEKKPSPIVFTDGSKATPLVADTRMVVQTVNAAQVILALHNGITRFDVTPNRERQFEVDAGFLKVLVLGTAFTVERNDTLSDESNEDRTLSNVSVTVHRGVVRATWSGGSRELRPAQGRVTFVSERLIATAEAPVAPSALYDITPEAIADTEEMAKPATSDAENDNQSQGPALSPMAEVLRLSDEARLKGNFDQAARYLESGLKRLPHAPLAATASFTLGRVLLEECHRPGNAANAFRDARQKAPNGPLAEDALAREVEARHLSGDQRSARKLALKYMELYPKGARTKSVRRFGSLE